MRVQLSRMIQYEIKIEHHAEILPKHQLGLWSTKLILFWLSSLRPKKLLRKVSLGWNASWKKPEMLTEHHFSYLLILCTQQLIITLATVAECGWKNEANPVKKDRFLVPLCNDQNLARNVILFALANVPKRWITRIGCYKSRRRRRRNNFFWTWRKQCCDKWNCIYFEKWQEKALGFDKLNVLLYPSVNLLRLNR